MVISTALRISATAWWGGSFTGFADLNFVGIALSAAMLVLLQKKKLGPVQAVLLSGGIGAVTYALLP